MKSSDVPILNRSGAQANLALPMLMQIDPEAAPKSVPRTIKKKPDPVNHPEYEEEEV